MALRTPQCPSCSSDLVLTSEGDLDTWKCRAGHGQAMTLQEAYGTLQNDEIHQLWQLARAAREVQGPRACPMCTRGMTPVELAYDEDEVPEGQPGDAADAGSLWLDVCEPCQVIWFDTHELAELPADLPDPEPSREEMATVSQIATEFGHSYETAVETRDAQTLTSRMSRRLRRR